MPPALDEPRLARAAAGGHRERERAFGRRKAKL
jgi:hypothetical protein